MLLQGPGQKEVLAQPKLCLSQCHAALLSHCDAKDSFIVNVAGLRSRPKDVPMKLLRGTVEIRLRAAQHQRAASLEHLVPSGPRGT